MLPRRGFLKGLVVSPFAAKKGINDLKADNVLDGFGSMDTSSPAVHGGRSFHEVCRQLNIVPDYVKKEHWLISRQVSMFDPDIASMKSLSLDAKVRKQRIRNYERMNKTFLEETKISSLRERFFKKYDI